MARINANPPEEKFYPQELRAKLVEINAYLGEALGEWDGVNLDVASAYGAPENLLPVYHARQEIISLLGQLAGSRGR